MLGASPFFLPKQGKLALHRPFQTSRLETGNLQAGNFNL
jgi:hypothetical protein